MSLNFSIRYPAMTSDDFNITHNLGKMAAEAGIYECLWKPGEHGYKTAADITPILEAGLRDLRARPEYFRQFDADNGWGLYEHFVPWVADVLESCHKHPQGEIEARR